MTGGSYVSLGPLAQPQMGPPTLAAPIGPGSVRAAMSERLIRALASARLRAREAHGQSAAEYVGVLLIVSVIVAGVATTEVGHDLTRALSGPRARHLRWRHPQEVT